MSPLRSAVALFLSTLAVFLFPGCAGMDALTQAGAGVAQRSGHITQEQASSITKTSSSFAKSFEDITPEQEYFIGRSVGATILGKYPPYGNQVSNRYLNLLGQALAQASDRPETFQGYHFQILETEEINAFAAPGGLIFVSRGMLRCCRTEDAVAAVLAHEIGHIQNQHGLKAIQTARLTTAFTILATEGAKSVGGKELKNLTQAFEGSISDITGTLMNSGYSRQSEREADAAAVKILSRVGYDPNALVAMLQEMEKRLKPGGLDFAKTHPSPQSRIGEVQGMIGSYKVVPVIPVRQERFRMALGNV